MYIPTSTLILLFFPSSLCWVSFVDRKLHSVLFYVEPASDRLYWVMFFKPAVSQSLLLTPTSCLSLRFWTGRGLYHNCCTSSLHLRDIHCIQWFEWNRCNKSKALVVTVKRILNKINVVLAFDVFMYQEQERKTKEAELIELFVYPVANDIFSKAD